MMGTFSGWQGDLVAPEEWREPGWLGCNAGTSAVEPSTGSGTTSQPPAFQNKSMK